MTLTLRGVPFQRVANAAGARNFDGAGYPFHALVPGLNFENATFVAKTTTLEARPGNMPLKDDHRTPAQFKPDCIRVHPWKGIVLNAVGLSGPGAQSVLSQQALLRWPNPFFVSFMSIKQTATERLTELTVFRSLLGTFLPLYAAKVGLEINFSCPNVGVKHKELCAEIQETLDQLRTLKIPVVVKLSPLFPVEQACVLAKHPALDALCMGNTIPWGEMPDAIPWKRLFGTEVSPLAHLGGGGLSGAPLKPIVEGWIRNARVAGFKKPIIACGGILQERDIDDLIVAGADAVQLGTVAIVRPWRVRRLVQHALAQFALAEKVGEVAA